MKNKTLGLLLETLVRRRSDDGDVPWSCMEHLNGCVLHTVQGGMGSNLHQHDDKEQVYYKPRATACWWPATTCIP